MGENIVGMITQKYLPKTQKDNFHIYLSGKDGSNYRVYLPKCEYEKDDIVQILAATQKTSSSGKVYYEANNISLVTETKKNEGGNTNTNTNNNGYTEPTREPVPQNLSHADKGSDMMETGIWTRAAPAVCKTIEDVEKYCDRALAYRRKKLGGNDEPFNDQF